MLHLFRILDWMIIATNNEENRSDQLWVKLVNSTRETIFCTINSNIPATLNQIKWKKLKIKASKQINQWTVYNIIIISQSYKVMTSCNTVNNIQATIIQMKKKYHRDQRKWKMNQWTDYMILIISQIYREFISCTNSK